MKCTQPAPVHAWSRAALVGLVTLGALAGCTSDHKASSAADASGSAKKAATAPSNSGGATVVVQHPLPNSSAIKNVPAKRANVQLTSCSQVPGGWEAAGTALNHAKQATSYVLTVFFTTDHGTVQDYATTTVKVGPGKTVAWKASKKFAGAPGTRCVLRGVG